MKWQDGLVCLGDHPKSQFDVIHSAAYPTVINVHYKSRLLSRRGPSRRPRSQAAGTGLQLPRRRVHRVVDCAPAEKTRSTLGVGEKNPHTLRFWKGSHTSVQIVSSSRTETERASGVPGHLGVIRQALSQGPEM